MIAAPEVWSYPPFLWILNGSFHIAPRTPLSRRFHIPSVLTPEDTSVNSTSFQPCPRPQLSPASRVIPSLTFLLLSHSPKDSHRELSRCKLHSLQSLLKCFKQKGKNKDEEEEYAVLKYVFIKASTSQSLSPFALMPLPLSPLSTTSMFLGIYESISVMCLFYYLVSTCKWHHKGFLFLCHISLSLPFLPLGPFMLL